jgi:peptidyl-prolyl cis-trans isomerase SurA
MKKTFLAAVTILCFTVIHSQTLFTYGKYSVDAREFLRAFNKNNAITPAVNRQQAIRDYLELYIKSKLKVREAYTRGYDTIPAIQSEVESLRMQIIDNYMTDPQAIDKLTHEAFKRSQKDIHAAHIFISFKNAAGATDMAAADKKKDEVMKRLNAGDDFFKVASELSDDPSAKMNKGDIGYITAFTLPYFFENIAYSTAPGKYSTPYRSKSGYHIFKNIEERPAVGKLKAAQILLAFPPGVTDDDKTALKKRMDSIYEKIKAGEDFSKLATQFSNDYVSASAGGTMQPFGVGRYEPEFEKVAFSLKKDGDLSTPFLTGHGYHIIKRTGTIPVVKDTNDKVNWNDLKAQVNNPERTSASQKTMVERIKKQVGFKAYPYNKDALQAYTDSIMNTPRSGTGNAAQQDRNAALFKIGDSTLQLADWIGYAQVFRMNANNTAKPTDELMEEFIQANVMQYYREHLEKYNDDFRSQMNEFKDGNLFFEIMQREIWNTAQSDSIGLRNYYESNRTKYNWKPSADAIIFYCSDEETAKGLFKKIKENPSEWQTAISSFEEKVSADSSRNELANIPNKNKMAFTPGMITTPVVNPNDKSASFAYIIKVYNTSSPRTFEEAKGLVINDYQNLLDEKWIAQLKKKYPVTVNQKVLQSILK